MAERAKSLRIHLATWKINSSHTLVRVLQSLIERYRLIVNWDLLCFL